MGCFRLIIDADDLLNSIRDMADRGEKSWKTFKHEVIREVNFGHSDSGRGEVLNSEFERTEFRKLIEDVDGGTYGLKSEVKKINEIVDAFRSSIEGEDYLPFPPGFKSIVLSGIKSDKEKANFFIELEDLLNSFGLKDEFRTLQEILSKAICETIEEDSCLSSFDYIYSEFSNDFVDYSQSFQFFLEGENLKFNILSSHVSEFLIDNRSKEAIICDNYLFKKDGDAMVRKVMDIWKFIVLELGNHYLESMIFVYNNYNIKDENKIEEKITSYLLQDNDLMDKLGDVEFYFVNLNEEGKSGGSKIDKKPKGIFHKREILTSKYRISFDTKVKFDNWNNFIELHPYYYGHVATYLTKSNQFRGFHLYRNLYYLKEVVEKSKNFKNFETAKNKLWRTEFFQRFEEVTKDDDLSVYFSELDFFNVKLEYCKV